MEQTGKICGEKLARSSASTLAAQLKSIFQEKIDSGEWAPDAMIPSENQLSAAYGVSRMTVRGVISEFVFRGRMYRVPGKGTFISDRKYEIESLMYSGLRGQLEEQGHSVSTRLIVCRRTPADRETAAWLDLEEGEEIYLVQRVRSANGVPISWHESYVPVRFCPGLEGEDLAGEQLCQILSRRYGIRRGRVEETLESFSAGKLLAKALKVAQGFPLLLLQDTLYTERDEIYEFSQVYFRGDRTKIRLEYRD